MDTDEGNRLEPRSLHRYLYASANPVNRIDPSGNDDILDLTMSMAIDSTLNSMAVTLLSSPAGNSVGSFLVSQFVPPYVWQGLQFGTPDAAEIGASLGVNLNTRMPFGITGGTGAEFLLSPKTGNSAIYTYLSLGGSWGATASSAGISGSAGLVFNMPNGSYDYCGPFLTFTMPMAWLSPSIRNAVAGDWRTAPFSGIGATIPAPYTSALAALRYAAGSAFSSSGSINVFYAPGSPHTFGLSLGIGSSWSEQSATTNLSGAFSEYYQEAPSANVKFE
jgi:hypothetical protein